MNFITLKAVSYALLPPLSLLLLGLLGWTLLYRRAGRALLLVCLTGLFLLSMPIVATRLAGFVENRPAGSGENPGDAQAIVILGAGSYPVAPEYGGDTVGAATLERVRWGARLHRSSGLPVLVSGGNPQGTRTTEAVQMKAALNQDFRTDVKWLDEKSFDTFESARYARQQLGAANIDRIALVTHALHMPRARLAFEQAGFHVIEAPTGFSTSRSPGILNYLPSAQGLELSSAVFHEVIGFGWYHVRLVARGQREQQ